MSAEQSSPERHPYIHAGGRSASWRAAGAEALGAALLVLLAPAPSPLAPLQAGLAVALIVQCLSWVSGAQVNPCVTLGAWWCGRMRGARALLEAAAQLTGAALGAATRALLPPGAGPRAAVTSVAPGYPLHKALCVEALCGCCVVLANCAQWREGGAAWPLRIGAVVAALAALAGDLTGGSMNPARSFGPALLSGHWDHHWVYWAGPLAGAAAACALHAALRPPHPPLPPHPPHPPREMTPVLASLHCHCASSAAPC